jgi:ABC-type multidrug transport system ATPase subunit
VEKVCSHLLVLRKGKVLAYAPAEQLQKDTGQSSLEHRFVHLVEEGRLLVYLCCGRGRNHWPLRDIIYYPHRADRSSIRIHDGENLRIRHEIAKVCHRKSIGTTISDVDLKYPVVIV